MCRCTCCTCCPSRRASSHGCAAACVAFVDKLARKLSKLTGNEATSHTCGIVHVTQIDTYIDICEYMYVYIYIYCIYTTGTANRGRCGGAVPDGRMESHEGFDASASDCAADGDSGGEVGALEGGVRVEDGVGALEIPSRNGNKVLKVPVLLLSSGKQCRTKQVTNMRAHMHMHTQTHTHTLRRRSSLCRSLH